MKYRFMFEQTEYPEIKWAETLGVSRSGYYAWKRAREERMEQEEKYIELVKNIFREGRGTYGAN